MTTARVAGESLVLLPERAAYWRARETLLVADPHFGKAAAFRAAGVPVPRGTTTDSVRRLDALLDGTKARRIVFLGDFLHAREGRSPETLRVINGWRARRGAIEMILVRGNHDARAGDPPRELALRCVNEPFEEPPFVYAHRPIASETGYVLAGHIHPAARLRGSGWESARLPCFWFGSRVGVLPAFGDFTGLADVNAGVSDRVWVIADGEVLPVAVPS